MVSVACHLESSIVAENDFYKVDSVSASTDRIYRSIAGVECPSLELSIVAENDWYEVNGVSASTQILLSFL